ncbi:MAG: hypothetical protein K6G64_11055 [Eubacterium sp.]|nr:hypothetical protein [Eubacterium sp.]
MKKSVFWGLSFIGIAVLIIASSLDLLHGLGFWTIFLTIVFCAVLIDGIMDFSVVNIVFSAAFLYLIWDKPMGWPVIPTGSLLIAALFAAMGLELLFKRIRIEKFKKKHMNDFKRHVEYFENDINKFGEHIKGNKNLSGTVEYDAGEYISCKSRYGGMKKYITSQNLKSVLVDVSFGSGEIYLDQANAPTGVVDMEIDCSFGSVKIYLPKSWCFENNIGNKMGFTIEGNPDGQNLVTVRATGDLNAGSISVRYI